MISPRCAPALIPVPKMHRRDILCLRRRVESVLRRLPYSTGRPVLGWFGFPALTRGNNLILMGREQRTHKNHGNARCIMKRIKSRMQCQEDSIPARVNPTGGTLEPGAASLSTSSGRKDNACRAAKLSSFSAGANGRAFRQVSEKINQRITVVSFFQPLVPP